MPGIGSLTLKTKAAQTDFVNTQILAPVDEIIFSPSSGNDANGFNEFTAISELMKKQLSEEGEVEITGVGTFEKDTATGIIQFQPVVLDTIFSPPVAAERVIRQDAEHSILVGDKETTNTAMTDYFSEKTEVKQYWWVWAAALGAAGVAMVAIYISQNGFNAFGNIMKP